jgi:hypothetical protein
MKHIINACDTSIPQPAITPESGPREPRSSQSLFILENADWVAARFYEAWLV